MIEKTLIRALITPNEDPELWQVLRKLLKDAYDQEGSIVAVFEVITN